MKQILRSAVLLSILALQGCSWVTIKDQYGTTYGGFFDFGNQYSWQLAACQDDPGLAKAAPGIRPRWMQCCMWRHGVPVDDSNGCAAPPYYRG